MTDSSAKAPYASSGHYSGGSPAVLVATPAVGTRVEFRFAGTSSRMARHRQLGPGTAHHFGLLAHQPAGA